VETIAFLGRSRPFKWTLAGMVALGLGVGLPGGDQASGNADAVTPLSVHLEVTNARGQAADIGERATSVARITNNGPNPLGNIIVLNNGAACGDPIDDPTFLIGVGESIIVECELGTVYAPFSNKVTVSADPVDLHGNLLYEPVTMARDSVEVAG